MRILLFIAVFLFPATACAQYVTHYPSELIPYENSICRITVNDGGNTRSHGSGVLFQSPPTHHNKHYVLTAYHVVRDRISRDSITVTWDGENHYPARIEAARPGCDAAVLTVDRAPSHLPRIPIATADIAPGELAYMFGFGSTSENRLRCTGGPALDFTSNEYNDNVWFTHAGQSRQGDSGGPIFVVRNGRPYVLGCGWGSRFDNDRGIHTVSGTRLRVLRRIFGQEKAAAFPARRGPSARMIYSSGSS